jgi:hypothetical protein
MDLAIGMGPVPARIGIGHGLYVVGAPALHELDECLWGEQAAEQALPASLDIDREPSDPEVHVAALATHWEAAVMDDQAVALGVVEEPVCGWAPLHLGNDDVLARPLRVHLLSPEFALNQSTEVVVGAHR